MKTAIKDSSISRTDVGTYIQRYPREFQCPMAPFVFYFPSKDYDIMFCLSSLINMDVLSNFFSHPPPSFFSLPTFCFVRSKEEDLKAFASEEKEKKNIRICRYISCWRERMRVDCLRHTLKKRLDKRWCQHRLFLLFFFQGHGGLLSRLRNIYWKRRIVKCFSICDDQIRQYAKLPPFIRARLNAIAKLVTIFFSLAYKHARTLLHPFSHSIKLCTHFGWGIWLARQLCFVVCGEYQEKEVNGLSDYNL